MNDSRKRPFLLPVFRLAWLCAAFGSGAYARTVTVATATALDDATGKLVAGDTLLVSAGNYDMTTWEISGLKGTENAWIVIRAQGKAVIRSTSNCCNLVQLSDLEYVKLIGFEVTMKTANDGVDGINMGGRFSHHVSMENLLIHDMTNNGISLYPDSAAFISLTNSEIHHTGGSGLYWGYPNRNTLHDILVQANYIHNCPADSLQDTHYGIQFKGWSYRSKFIDNVLHDVGGTSRSGLIVYYGKKPLAGDVPGDINIVSGNVLWNCRNEGITVMSDALIENNIVMDALVGINIQTYSDTSFQGTTAVENLTVRNNTVYRCQSTCIAISGWANAGTGVYFWGNAAYQDAAGKPAIQGSLGKGSAGGNVAFGTSSIAGTKAGTGLADFLRVTAAGAPASCDFYPSAASPLLEAVADAAKSPEKDFNGTARPQGAAADAGAYERGGAENPGWAIGPGFKSGSSLPVRPVKGKPRPAKPGLGNLRITPGVGIAAGVYFHGVPDRDRPRDSRGRALESIPQP